MNLNIFQTNQISNIDINETKLTDIGQTKAAMQILGELSDIIPGTTLTGTLVSKDGTSLSLLLQNNLSLHTSLESDANIMPGQILNFEVTGNDKGHITVRPLHTNMANEETITRALDNAGLRINNATIDMVDGLMREGMPINKETLVNYNRYINTYPQADIKDIIMLNKMDIELNSDNLEQMHLYNNNNQWMMNNISTLSEDFTLVLNEVANKSPEEFNDFVQTLIEIIEPEVTEGEAGADKIISENELNKDEVLGEVKGKEDTTVIEKEETNENEKIQVQNDINVFERLKRIDVSSFKDSETVQHVKKGMKEALSKAFLMEPEKFEDKEYVKKYYEKIDNVAKNIEQLLEHNNKSDSLLSKDMSMIKNNVSFMNQINEMYNYVQLPLKMADNHANGELYVYTKKKTKHEDDEPLTALLHLSMEYLGNMDIFLKLDSGKLSTKFCLEKEENIDLIESHIDELNKRLVDKGYNSEISVQKQENAHENVVDNIRNEKNGIVILSEKGFDARA